MAIFRVRNLLIQVLPREAQGAPLICADIDSGDGGCDDSGDCGDSLDCGDTGDCGNEDTGGCDPDSCGDPDTGGCGPDSRGCGTDSCVNPDTGGCGSDSCDNPDTGGCGSDSCGNPDTGGCGNPDTPACTAFECSLHFDTICEPGQDPTGCDQITQICEIPGVTVHCPGPVTLECIAIGSQCNVLNSLPICPDPTNTRCVEIISHAPQVVPAGVCFRSNEPRLNPNSLADLGVLRRQLAASLKTVQRREQVLAKALTPRTTRQIATAEAYLTSALRDLKRRKQFVQARVAAAKKAIESKEQAAAPKGSKKSPAKKASPRKGGRRK